jgi:hypothetical protein
MAAALFDTEGERPVRIDMSEYRGGTPSAAWSARPRDTWYEEAASSPERCAASLLRGAVRRSREAHPDVFNTLLQVLDDSSSPTREKGRTVNFGTPSSS